MGCIQSKKCQALTLPYPHESNMKLPAFFGLAACNKLISGESVRLNAYSKNVTYFAVHCFVGLLQEVHYDIRIYMNEVFQ